MKIKQGSVVFHCITDDCLLAWLMISSQKVAQFTPRFCLNFPASDHSSGMTRCAENHQLLEACNLHDIRQKALVEAWLWNFFQTVIEGITTWQNTSGLLIDKPKSESHVWKIKTKNQLLMTRNVLVWHMAKDRSRNLGLHWHHPPSDRSPSHLPHHPQHHWRCPIGHPHSHSCSAPVQYHVTGHPHLNDWMQGKGRDQGKCNAMIIICNGCWEIKPASGMDPSQECWSHDNLDWDM